SGCKSNGMVKPTTERSSEPAYFIIIDGKELGPYPINLLRKMLAKGPLHEDTLCRSKNSSRIVPRSSIINAGAATAAKPDVSGPVEHAIRFQSFVRPAANPYRFRGRGTVSIQGNELRLSGKRSRPFWFSRESTVAILF